MEPGFCECDVVHDITFLLLYQEDESVYIFSWGPRWFSQPRVLVLPPFLPPRARVPISRLLHLALTYHRWFALVRIWNPWLAPRHGKSSFELDKDAVLCSFLSPQGKHMVLLGISGLSDTMTLFRSSDSGQVHLHVSSVS